MNEREPKTEAAKRLRSVQERAAPFDDREFSEALQGTEARGAATTVVTLVRFVEDGSEQSSESALTQTA